MPQLQSHLAGLCTTTLGMEVVTITTCASFACFATTTARGMRQWNTTVSGGLTLATAVSGGRRQ